MGKFKRRLREPTPNDDKKEEVNMEKQDTNAIYINKEGDTVEAPEFKIETPKQSSHGAFNFNKLELFKACPDLYNECEEMGDYFVLLVYDPKRYKNEVENLRAYLLHFWQTHRITLDFPLWFKLIFSCLEPAKVTIQEIFDKQ